MSAAEKKRNDEAKREEEIKHLANVTLRPSTNAAAIVCDYSKAFGEQDISALMTELGTSMEALKTNDLSRCENMLLGQAHALQSMFTNLSRRAIIQEYMKNMETYLRMAFKAQNQCRMTLETLATIKNPPIIYAKQANINHGNQQVNNGSSPPSHAEKTKTSPNELLEENTHENEWLDTRAPSKASRTNQAMATVEKVQRRKN